MSQCEKREERQVLAHHKYLPFDARLRWQAVSDFVFTCPNAGSKTRMNRWLTAGQDDVKASRTCCDGRAIPAPTSACTAGCACVLILILKIRRFWTLTDCLGLNCIGRGSLPGRQAMRNGSCT